MNNKQAAMRVLERLCDAGFEALFAGGCVRDMLLGRPANDFDVATNAAPAEVIKLFRRTLKVGLKFGVVIVLIESRQVQVATFRTEAEYVDGRHPTAVEFTGAKADAARRDFTINGMFYNPLERKVIDYVSGQADLKKRLVRTIGEPEQRFGEDYLRMLRAVRFSTQLGFKIEPSTWSAICSGAKKIARISPERIATELEAILVNPNRSVGAAMLVKSGLASAIFPGFDGRQARVAIKVLSQLRKKVDFALALAGFFAGFEAEFAIEGCEILKLSKSQNKHIKFLLANRGRLLEPGLSLAELKLIVAEPYFWNLYEFQRAIQKAKVGTKLGMAPLIALRRKIRAWGEEELRPKPFLDGHALIQLGAVPGPALGQLAEEMYIAQLERQLQTREQAEQWVRQWLQKHRDVEK